MLMTLPPDYSPTDAEPFMSAQQQAYFRAKLLRWRGDLLREAGITLSSMGQGGIVEADLTDRAAREIIDAEAAAQDSIDVRDLLVAPCRRSAGCGVAVQYDGHVELA